MYGFIHQLRESFIKLKSPDFGFGRLKYMLSQHCNTQKYKDKSKYGIRHDINNKPVHRLVKVDSE